MYKKATWLMAMRASKLSTHDRTKSTGPDFKLPSLNIIMILSKVVNVISNYTAKLENIINEISKIKVAVFIPQMLISNFEV